MATAIATKLAERKLKSELEDMTPQVPEGEGPQRRGKLSFVADNNSEPEKIVDWCSEFCTVYLQSLGLCVSQGSREEVEMEKGVFVLSAVVSYAWDQRGLGCCVGVRLMLSIIEKHVFRNDTSAQRSMSHPMNFYHAFCVCQKCDVSVLGCYCPNLL